MPFPAQVVVPSRMSTMAVTPAPKDAFEKIPARHSPNDPAMTNMATGNHAMAATTHERASSCSSGTAKGAKG